MQVILTENVPNLGSLGDTVKVKDGYARNFLLPRGKAIVHGTKKSKEIEIKLIARLRKHKDNPKFVALGERLEKLKERHEQGLLHSLDFLKELLTLAREVVQAEKQVDPVDEQAKAKAALTELFAEVKNGKTPMVIERIVTDIDEIVRLVRFPGWQNTKAGEREVQKALRKVIYVKYQVKDQDLFDKAFGYIRQYY